VRQGGPGDPGDADHVHVEHPVPFLVAVGGDVAGGGDPGVVDQNVDPPSRSTTSATAASTAAAELTSRSPR
jgi:hypothetical protein